MATKLYGELNLSGRLRAIQKQRFKAKLVETDLDKIPSPKDSTISLTDSSVMDRIYILPKLKTKQLLTAIQQKIRKDLEFIAEPSEVDWIFSKFPERGSYKILVSIIKKSDLNRLPEFHAITTTSQVIANFLEKKKKEDYLLVHSFFDDCIVFVFRNGQVDYIRGFKRENSVDEAVEITLEYYKEQHKTEIGTIVFSGDSQPSQHGQKKLIPLNEFVKISTSDLKFFVPQLLTSQKVPFFYEKKFLKPIHLTVPVSALILIAGLGLQLEKQNVIHKIDVTNKKIETFRNKINQNQQTLTSLTEKEKTLEGKLNNPAIKFLLSSKKPEIYTFLKSIEDTLKKSKSYVLSLEGSKDQFTLSTITFCKNLKKAKELHTLISGLKANPTITSVTLLSAKEVKEFKAIIADFKIKLRAESYVE